MENLIDTTGNGGDELNKLNLEVRSAEMRDLYEMIDTEKDIDRVLSELGKSKWYETMSNPIYV